MTNIVISPFDWGLSTKVVKVNAFTAQKELQLHYPHTAAAFFLKPEDIWFMEKPESCTLVNVQESWVILTLTKFAKVRIRHINSSEIPWLLMFCNL